MDQPRAANDVEESDADESVTSGVPADIIFGVLLLIGIPLGAGFIRVGILWFGAYGVLAAGVFSCIAWLRERRRRDVSMETMVLASLARLALVFVIGGIFYAGGLMIP